MAKNFAPRKSKRERRTIDATDLLGEDIFKKSNDKLLEGAKLDEVLIDEIFVKEQVRTKFNDDSLKELSENIRVNGLIQPLVVHRKDGKLTLICGERRYRAMNLIGKKTTPCFVLENKTEEELMAIQFSENSAREELHYIDKADGIYSYQKATKASERKIVAALGISKSEVHRSLLIAKMPQRLKEAAKQHNTEKYVLIELDAMNDGELKDDLMKAVEDGKVTRRAELKKSITTGGVVQLKKAPKRGVKRGTTAAAFIKAMDKHTESLELDEKTLDLLKKVVAETKEIVD